MFLLGAFSTQDELAEASLNVILMILKVKRLSFLS